jgi:hypothetical protein
VTSALKGIGTVALGGLALGAVAATGAIAAIGPAAIEAASDLNESMSKANIVFGDSIRPLTLWQNEREGIWYLEAAGI